MGWRLGGASDRVFNKWHAKVRYHGMKKTFAGIFAVYSRSEAVQSTIRLL